MSPLPVTVHVSTSEGQTKGDQRAVESIGAFIHKGEAGECRMRLEQTPRPEQSLRVSARLITSSTILHLSSDELDRAVNQEHMGNPALDVTEKSICLFCGTRIYGQGCSACGHLSQLTHLSPPMPQMNDVLPSYEFTEPQWAYQQQTFYDIDNYG